jgi:hypothetical protein
MTWERESISVLFCVSSIPYSVGRSMSSLPPFSPLNWIPAIPRSYKLSRLLELFAFLSKAELCYDLMLLNLAPSESDLCRTRVERDFLVPLDINRCQKHAECLREGKASEIFAFRISKSRSESMVTFLCGVILSSAV